MSIEKFSGFIQGEPENDEGKKEQEMNKGQQDLKKIEATMEEETQEGGPRIEIGTIQGQEKELREQKEKEWNPDDAVKKEKSILESLREKGRNVVLVMTFLTAFSALKATVAYAEGSAGFGGTAKAERVEQKSELEQIQDKVIDALKVIKKNLSDKNDRRLAQKFIQGWFFEYTVTEDVAKTVLEDAGMNTPDNFKELVKKRKDELKNNIEELRNAIQEKGDAFNKDNTYWMAGDLPPGTEVQFAKEGEELEWLERFGIEGNKEVMDAYKQKQIQKMFGAEKGF